MPVSWAAFKRVRHWASTAACIVVLGSLQSAAQSASSTCPTSPGRCPPEGCSTSNSPFAPYDPILNVQKNHLDGPPVPKNPPFKVADMMDESQLPVHVPAPPKSPDNPDLRKTWNNTQAYADISRFEQRQATVEGYVARVNQEGAESCNCGITSPEVVDTHINVIDRPQDPNADPATLAGASVIVEVTWRIRRNSHPDWTVANLKKLDIQHNGARVRITGDLLYDNVHWGMVHKGQRGTLWEIHPIRSIQVLVQGRWVDYSLNQNALFQFVVNPHPVRAPNGARAIAPGLPLTATWRPQWNAAQQQRFEQAFADDHS